MDFAWHWQWRCKWSTKQRTKQSLQCNQGAHVAVYAIVCSTIQINKSQLNSMLASTYKLDYRYCWLQLVPIWQRVWLCPMVHWSCSIKQGVNRDIKAEIMGKYEMKKDRTNNSAKYDCFCVCLGGLTIAWLIQQAHNKFTNPQRAQRWQLVVWWWLQWDQIKPTKLAQCFQFGALILISQAKSVQALWDRSVQATHLLQWPRSLLGVIQGVKLNQFNWAQNEARRQSKQSQRK